MEKISKIIFILSIAIILFLYLTISIQNSYTVNQNIICDTKECETESHIKRSEINITILSQYINISTCEQNHLKRAKVYSKNLHKDFNISICGETATNRGYGQKVISYSFFGKRLHQPRKYFQGIERNIAGIQEYYPGWFMRVYYNVENESDRTILYQLQCKYSDILDLCDVSNLPVYGNITASSPHSWRFIALGDPLVDIVMSRDLDSLIIPREVAAVNEWINDYPNASFHIMRDNPDHGTQILAGMWGAKIWLNRSIFKTKSEAILTEAFIPSHVPSDQRLLTKYIWPLRNKKGFMLTHDSYLCQNYTSGNELGFPTERNMSVSYNFVGAPVEFGTFLKKECPIQCRRNTSWIYC